MDGVDASIIQTDGKIKYKAIFRQILCSIDSNLNPSIRDIKISNDLKKLQKEIKSIEKDITIFHAELVKRFLKKLG